jgi:hypothetical protein
LEQAADLSSEGPSFASRTTAWTTLVIGIVIGIVGGLIAKTTGQSLQGSILTAVGAFLGAMAISLMAGGRSSKEQVEDGVRMAGVESRGQIRENFYKASVKEKIADPEQAQGSKEE